MQRIDLNDVGDARVADYRDLKDAALARRRDRFVVEGPGTLDVLLEHGRFEPESILLSQKAWAKIGERLSARDPNCPVYVMPDEVLDAVVGFPIHRGYLAVCKRPLAEDALVLAKRVLTEDPRARIVVTESIGNHDNLGGLFRNARAFGARAVLLCPRSADPLYRKAIRTSMGGALCVPFARAPDWPGALKELKALGYRLLALDPAEAGGAESVLLGSQEWMAETGPVALLLGSEGPGLSGAARAAADLRVRIEMDAGVDSVNVAVAAGIALHGLRMAGGAAMSEEPAS